MNGPFAAWRFDGRTAEAHPASLCIDGATLVIESGGSTRRVPIAEASISERFAATPRMVRTPGGETFEVSDGPGFTRAIEAAGFPASAVVRLQGWGPAVAGALALLVAALVLAYTHGVPAAARWAAHETPRAAQERLGQALLDLLDEKFLAPSALPVDVREAVETRFASAAELAAPSHRVRLEFRRDRPTEPEVDGPEPDAAAEEDPPADGGEEASVNAMSLPGDIIVLLDGLVDVADADQVFAVLGHELGHIVLEHSMQTFYRSAGVAALAGLAWGDFSGVAAGVPIALGLLHYDRELEDEADDFAVRFLTIERLGPEALCGFFDLILELEEEMGVDGIPEFLSTHPDTSDRIGRLCPEW
ncbi:MAG TPA: M48 family metallopeptidase [Myxococcota bacterium]|jgi:Zn-dependent protease with chaperone function